MKNCLLIIAAFILSFSSLAQDLPSSATIENAPIWAQMMYGENPNVFQVETAYEAYYHDNVFEKSYHTQYYKRWRRNSLDFVNDEGYIILPSSEAQEQKRQDLIQNDNANDRSGTWGLLGPIVAYNTNGELVSQQANIYSIDQAPSDANTLYCGTEPGEIYKSTDGGTSWFNVSLNDPLNGGVNAIKIHPTNPDIVLAGSGNVIYKTIDGGVTWSNVLSNVNRTNEIQFVPSDPTKVFAATNTGFYQSSDTGDSWTMFSGEPAYDVKINTGNDNIIYLVQRNPSSDVCDFWISTDMGVSFNSPTSGWYNSTDPDRYCGGARIGISDADPNRVYVYLIGEAKTGDTGFIGVYRSNDGGLNWTLPNGPDGGPYDAVHQNLAVGSTTWQYHQGYYNCAIMASNTNPDEILVGGLNLYKSDDGGATFYPLAGYVGGSYNMHVDMQDFRSFGSTTWITTDGGIYRSTDFFNTDGYESRMNGIHSSDYWGFGQGWNEDVTVGGLYHNGNLASFDNYGAGNFLQLGGGEPASGYVNPGESRRVYSSDINGKIIPMNIGDPVKNVGFGIDPNESYWSVESTEMEFDPRTFSVAYTGKDNELWKTEDAGVTFTLFASFGSNVDDDITYIEIAWSNPDVMYVCQQIGSSSVGKLWRTEDAGVTWDELTLPTVSNSRKMLIQVDPEDENLVYIAFASAGNGQKIYSSIDGGTNWLNISTNTLDNQNARSIAFVGGTDGGIYYATNQTIYYRNNSMSDWDDFGDGLPVEMNTNIIRLFYRDAKLRLASYGKGIWESPLFEAPSKPIAQISVDKLNFTMHCESDTFHYVDHSMLNHSGATWEWTFEGGSPATGNSWEENVTYDTPGTYLTILTVTNAGGVSDTDSLYIVIDPYIPTTILDEDFETGFVPNGFEIVNADEGQTWELSTDAGGFGLSSQSMVMRGYDYWPGGDVDDIRVSMNMDYLQDAWLTFDVAYARYAVNYSDTLEVLVSLDCGQSYTSLYYKGGSDLATAPDNNSFYIPASDEWRKDSIDLSIYEGNPDVMIVFRSITGWGNNIYVDNINLDATDHSEVEENDEVYFSVYPNPIAAEGILNLNTNLEENVIVDIFSADGKLVYRQEHMPVDQIDIAGFSSGTYIYLIRSSEVIKKGLLVID